MRIAIVLLIAIIIVLILLTVRDKTILIIIYIKQLKFTNNLIIAIFEIKR